MQTKPIFLGLNQGPKFGSGPAVFCTGHYKHAPCRHVIYVLIALEAIVMPPVALGALFLYPPFSRRQRIGRSSAHYASGRCPWRRISQWR